MGFLYLKQIRRGIIPSHHPTGMTDGCREWKKCPTFGLKRPPTQKYWLRACNVRHVLIQTVIDNYDANIYQ